MYLYRLTAKRDWEKFREVMFCKYPHQVQAVLPVM